MVEICAAYSHYLSHELAGSAEICGPAEAPYAKIKDRFRRQIIIKAADIRRAADAAEKAWVRTRQEERLPADIRLALDIDPMNML